MANNLSITMPLREALVETPRPAGGLSDDVRALTERIAHGDEEAFNWFYDQYSPRLFRLLTVVTRGDEDLTRELHQRVMITSAQKLKRLETEQELWAWLTQVARNKWRDVLRRRAREIRALDKLEPVEMTSPSSRQEFLREGLEALSPSDRELVETFYFEATPQLEIARSSGRSVKAVQCALARIRRRLRRFLGNEQ